MYKYATEEEKREKMRNQIRNWRASHPEQYAAQKKRAVEVARLKRERLRAEKDGKKVSE